MVRVPPPLRPLSAAPRLRQDYEGHGLLAPFPSERGYRHDVDRPSTAAENATRLPPPSIPEAGAPADAAPASRKGKKKASNVPTFTIHAHIREKTIAIRAGEGNQCIYWLGAAAVRRYLSQPFSYTWTFSEEMTCKAVIDEDGAHIARTDRVRDTLVDGAHVWIDVGDGAPISRTLSRSLPERGLFEPSEGEYQEQIGWHATAADIFDDEVVGIDPRQSMSYKRTVVSKQPTFKEWQQRQSASSSSQEGLFEIFNKAWQAVTIEDLPGSTSWMNDVKAAFWHNFESLQYVFGAHAAAISDPSKPPEMSLLEFWAFCKRCALPSPWFNMNKINRLFVPKGAVNYDPHNPRTTMNLPTFLGALVRISVLRQPGSKNDDVPLPYCLQKLIEDRVLVLTPGFDTFDPQKAMPAVFSSPAVRQKLTIHESRLKKLFYRWAVTDETRETVQLSEFLEMFAGSDIMGADLNEGHLTKAFVHAMLGPFEGGYEQWVEAGDKACTELIFSEYVEAIMRAALFKFESDTRTPVDLKVHEVCLLLIFGPAGTGL